MILPKLQAEKRFQLRGHGAAVYCLEKGLRPGTVLSGSSDHFVAQWNLQEGQADTFSIKAGATVYALHYYPLHRQLFVGTQAGQLHVIDLQERREIKNLQYHTKGIFSIAVSAKHQLLFTAGADGLLNIYSMAGLEHLKTIRLGFLKLRSLLLHEASDRLFVANGDGSVNVIDLFRLEVTTSFAANKESCNALCLHHNGRWLLTGGRDAHLNVYDIEQDYALVKRIPAHNYAIYDILYLPELNFYATASRDKTIKLWSGNDLSVLLRIHAEKHEAHKYSVNCLYWDSDTQQLVSAGDDGLLMCWKLSMELQSTGI